VAIVLAGFVVVVALAFGMFVIVLGRFFSGRAHQWGKQKSTTFLFCAAVLYGVAIAALFFGLIGQFRGSFLKVGGFWLNALVGGVSVAVFMTALRVPKTT
jgi:hypothetical protein